MVTIVGARSKAQNQGIEPDIEPRINWQRTAEKCYEKYGQGGIYDYRR